MPNLDDMNLTHIQESNESQTETGLSALLGQQKKREKILRFPHCGLPSFSKGRLEVFHDKDLPQISANFFVVDFFFFLKELKQPSQSTHCRRQSILMVRLLNTLRIFTVDQQKVMKHRCSCNCDTLGKFILLNEPQLHSSTCVMWKCTVGTQAIIDDT